jgi:hypothetical protein
MPTTKKRVLRPDRLRRIPHQFSWIDQRLVREHYIERCEHSALALYLFVVTVADAQGLSYYGEHSLCRALSMTVEQLAQARATLIRAGLIAYERPLYQVLALDPPTLSSSSARTSGPVPISDSLLRLRQSLTTKTPSS